MDKKILVCGNGPSLPGQLKNRDLSDFFVVRVNPWVDIPGCDNRCDAWAFYPYTPNIEKCLKKAKSLWMPHFGMADECKRVTGRYPDYIITREHTIDFHLLIGNPHPTSGAVSIYMAMKLCKPVYIAGFDFYQQEKGYYYSEEKQTEVAENEHHPLIEKQWIDKCIKEKTIIKLGAN